MSFLLAAVMATAAALPADAHSDPVDIVDQAAWERGDLSQVLVLGTAHLSGLPKDFDLTRFDPLINELERWQPEAIAIENMSGPQCDFIKDHAHAYPGTWDRYCSDPAPARESLGLTGSEADREIRDLLGVPKDERPATERRRLAALFLAIGDANSALVQWLRLPPEERMSEGALTDTLAGLLDKRMGSRNESSFLAARLAARLGHEQVYPVDDHTGDIATGPVDDAIYEREIRAIWTNPATEERFAIAGEQDRQVKAGEMTVIEWYRAMNSPDIARLAMQSDFGAAAGSREPGQSGRKYLAYWETRNLRMVANLREVIGPGRRVLALVGASHKPYYERYLGMTSDVELVDVVEVLGPSAE